MGGLGYRAATTHDPPVFPCCACIVLCVRQFCVFDPCSIRVLAAVLEDDLAARQEPRHRPRGGRMGGLGYRAATTHDPPVFPCCMHRTLRPPILCLRSVFDPCPGSGAGRRFGRGSRTARWCGRPTPGRHWASHTRRRVRHPRWKHSLASHSYLCRLAAAMYDPGQIPLKSLRNACLGGVGDHPWLDSGQNS